MFPDVVVVKAPSGIIVILQEYAVFVQIAGAVIVAIAVVPVTWKNGAVGEMVVDEAIAACA